MHGTYDNGDIWETGFWLNGTGVSSEGAANALAEIITATLNSEDSSGAMRILAASFWTTGVHWTETRSYVYTGGSTATYVGLYVLPVVRTGLGTTNILPNQVSLVLTTLTGLAGRRNRGRMYLPVNFSPLTGAGLFPASDVNVLTDSMALAFTDINASDTGKVVLVSRTGTTARQISAVRADQRPDIQRRRANKEGVGTIVNWPVTL